MEASGSGPSRSRRRYYLQNSSRSGDDPSRSRSERRMRMIPSQSDRSRSRLNRSRSRDNRSQTPENEDAERRQSGVRMVPGSLLAGIEYDLLLMRRSLLIMTNLNRSAPELMDDKPLVVATSSTFIDNLPESQILETGIECSICLAKFRRGTKASILPCNHQFHLNCIRPWLKKNNSCPFCRHELPVDEPAPASYPHLPSFPREVISNESRAEIEMYLREVLRSAQSANNGNNANLS